MPETNLISKIGWKTVFLVLGITDIAFFFIMFNPELIFSLAITLLNIVLLACGIFFLLHADYPNDNAEAMGGKEPSKYSLLLVAVSALIVLYEANFNLQNDPTALGYIIGYLPMVIAALVSILAIYVVGRMFQNIEFQGLYSSKVLQVFALLAIASFLAFFIITNTLHTLTWKGTDEIAFDYYSAHLLINGTNPYTANMRPILRQFRLDPTLRLNSSCECQYGYPALSFLPFAALQLAGLNYYPDTFVFVTALCVTISSFLVYYKSGKNLIALLPLFLFILAAYSWTPAGNVKFLAVSVLFLVAYLERRNLYLSNVCLGLAASTHQLAWAAIPFFYVLTYNEYGRSWLIKSAAVSLATFLLVNSYFLAVSPQAFISNLFLFTGKLAFTGPNLMQALISFYPVPYWYSTAMLLLFYAASLLLFYLYTGTLRSLLAIVPATMFFFSWTNDFVYFLSFVPILLCILYVDKEKAKNRTADAKWARYAAIALAFVAVALLLFANAAYLSVNTLSINSVTFTWYVNSTTNTPSLYAVVPTITNNGANAEQLLFYAATKNPSHHAYIVGVPTYVIGPHATENFTLQYGLSHITRSTQIFVYVMSNDYIQGAAYTIPLSSQVIT